MATCLLLSGCSGNRNSELRDTRIGQRDAMTSGESDAAEAIGRGDETDAGEEADADAPPDASGVDAAGERPGDAALAALDGTAVAELDASHAASSASLDSAAGDAEPVDADAASDAATPDAGATATMFLSHSLNNAIYRFSIAPDRAPVLNATISAPAPEGMAMSAAGELFAASEDGSVLRFENPLGTPRAKPSLTNLGVSSPEEIAFVDDELWIPSTVYTSCTNDASKITRVGFDANGAASVLGELRAPGIVTAGRGMLWEPTRRMLFLSQCEAINRVQPYRVTSEHTLEALTTASAGDLMNPHGIVFSHYGELLVASAGGNRLARFSISPELTLISRSRVAGNLNVPIGLAAAPWPELYAVNQGDGSIGRFLYQFGDTSPELVPGGNYVTGLDSSPNTHRLGWILIVPQPSTSLGADSGT
jgi:sugar lactone lactonase YvrE